MKSTERCKIWIDVFKSLIGSFGKSKANILNTEETIELLEQTGKSFIRFGDGEIGIFRGKSVHYQQWSKELYDNFLKLKEQYERDKECTFILGVPYKYFANSSIKLLKKRVLISSWAQSKFYFQREFSPNITYGDAFLFAKGKEDMYSKIWFNCENIVFVHNNIRYAKQFEKRYHKKVFFVEIPSHNTFEQYGNIFNRICDILNTLEKDKTQVLVSAGPAGKLLVLDIAKMGFRAIDTGRCWDDPLDEY